MGRLAKLLSFVRTVRNGAKVNDVKVDPGGGANITAEHFTSIGDDSYPLDTDYVALNDDSGTGKETSIGYLDPISEPKAAQGDKRIYARDSSTGLAVVDFWLKNDGTGTMENANGSFTLAPDGSITGSNSLGSFALQAGGNFVVNGVIIDITGNVTLPGGTVLTAPTVAALTSLTALTKEIAGHAHSQADDSGGNTEQDTGPNN